MTPFIPDDRRGDVDLRHAAWVAGIGLLVMAVLSPFAFFYVLPRVIVAGDMAQTARNVAAHQGFFLWGIACYLVTFIADIVVAWALYVLLRPAHPSLAMLAAWFRLVYATIALGALGKLVTVLRLVRVPDYLSAYGAVTLHAQMQLLVSAFHYEWGLSMIFFGIHLGLLGVLVYRSRYVPKWLGVLLVITGIGYLIDTLRPYLAPGLALPWLPVLFFGELVFMLWLLIRGSRLGRSIEAVVVEERGAAR